VERADVEGGSADDKGQTSWGGPPCTTRSPRPTRTGVDRFGGGPRPALAYAYGHRLQTGKRDSGGGCLDQLSNRSDPAGSGQAVFALAGALGPMGRGREASSGKKVRASLGSTAFNTGPPPHRRVSHRVGQAPAFCLLTGPTRPARGVIGPFTKSGGGCRTRSPRRRPRSTADAARKEAGNRRQALSKPASGRPA